jgi:hypothetical protein
LVIGWFSLGGAMLMQSDALYPMLEHDPRQWNWPAAGKGRTGRSEPAVAGLQPLA